ncbi:MAG: hypothetical protein R3B90_11245 [Planctomycetaceae bacterium]
MRKLLRQTGPFVGAAVLMLLCLAGTAEAVKERAVRAATEAVLSIPDLESVQARLDEIVEPGETMAAGEFEPLRAGR